VRYRSDRPIWTDTAFAALAAVTTGTGVLAAVRSATTGLPVTTTAAAPFGEGPWLFSHNGLIRGWPGAVAGLAAELPVTDLLTLDAPTESATACGSATIPRPPSPASCAPSTPQPPARG
jgi:glutamine amidotransferase